MTNESLTKRICKRKHITLIRNEIYLTHSKVAKVVLDTDFNFLILRTLYW